MVGEISASSVDFLPRLNFLSPQMTLLDLVGTEVLPITRYRYAPCKPQTYSPAQSNRENSCRSGSVSVKGAFLNTCLSLSNNSSGTEKLDTESANKAAWAAFTHNAQYMTHSGMSVDVAAGPSQ